MPSAAMRRFVVVSKVLFIGSYSFHIDHTLLHLRFSALGNNGYKRNYQQMYSCYSIWFGSVPTNKNLTCSLWAL